MANPITWRTINAPQATASASAGASMLNAGLDRLSKAAQTYGENQTNSATDALLGQIASVNSMDAYNALRSQIAQNGVGNADVKSVWEALNAADNRIRTDLSSQLQLDTAQRTEAERVAADPYLNQIAKMNKIGDIDKFVAGLASMEPVDNLNVDTLVKAAEERRNALEGNVNFSNQQTTFGQQQDEYAIKVDDRNAVTEGNNQLQSLLATAKDDAAWRDGVAQITKDMSPAAAEQVQADADAMWTRAIAPTIAEANRIADRDEDIMMDEYISDSKPDVVTTFKDERTAMDAESLKIEQNLNKIPKQYRPDQAPQTLGDVTQMLQQEFGFSEDRMFSWDDYQAEDVPAALMRLEKFLENTYPELKETGVPMPVLIESIKAAGLNDFEGKNGELDLEVAKERAKTALKEWNDYQKFYQEEVLNKKTELTKRESEFARGLVLAKRNYRDTNVKQANERRQAAAKLLAN